MSKLHFDRVRTLHRRGTVAESERSGRRWKTSSCRRGLALFAATGLTLSTLLSSAGGIEAQAATTSDDTITLRVCNWEEYIDQGGWSDDEVIDLPSGDIIGKNSMVTDFENWYQETYGQKVKVEYSTFGTNEDLYNMLTLGDTYDLVCPSEYMFMKLIHEGKVQPLSDHFFDETDEHNYYIKGVSPYLRKIFEDHDMDGEPWSHYAAGYMWGITGIVYNPALMTREEASTWAVLADPAYRKRVTIKDSVREAYFIAMSVLHHDMLGNHGCHAQLNRSIIRSWRRRRTMLHRK